MAFDFDPNLARTVKADSLTPRQRPTGRALRTKTDFYRRVMLKHPGLSEFHYRPELLHACLLEGDPRVLSYVPQPYHLRVGKRWYTPDCYVLAEDAPRRVVELKPRGEFEEALQVPLLHFFALHGLEFVVVSNESVLERETEALNWLEIVSILQLAQALDTTEAELRVLEIFAQRGPCILGELVDAGDRQRTYLQEIALFRLLHQGHLAGALGERALDYDTGFWRCP